MENKACCGGETKRHESGCLLCGEALHYLRGGKLMVCAVCGKKKRGNAFCENGHFVCDDCHAYGSFAAALPLLRESTQQDPLQLFEEVARLPQIHRHGPEHHRLVPLILLTAYRNCGGQLNYEGALREANARAGRVPGGTCGYWGVCGAAAGAGIYASLLLGSHPLNAEVWPHAQRLVAEILQEIASLGGVRCCKRTSRLALTHAAAFTAQHTGVEMPVAPVQCTLAAQNRECLGEACPYWPGA